MDFKYRLYKNNIKIFSRDLAHWCFIITVCPRSKTKLLKQEINNLPIGNYDIDEELGYINIDTEIYTTSMNKNFFNCCIEDIKNKLSKLFNESDFKIYIKKKDIHFEYLPWPDSNYAIKQNIFTDKDKLKIIHCLTFETEYFKNINNLNEV